MLFFFLRERDKHWESEKERRGRERARERERQTAMLFHSHCLQWPGLSQAAAGGPQFTQPGPAGGLLCRWPGISPVSCQMLPPRVHFGRKRIRSWVCLEPEHSSMGCRLPKLHLPTSLDYLNILLKYSTHANKCIYMDSF